MPEMIPYARTGTIETKLAEWLRCATPAQQLELAHSCGTSVGYLRLLAHAHRENPRIRLAMDIVACANQIREIAAVTYEGKQAYNLPELNLIDIATPTKRPAICGTPEPTGQNS